MIRLRHHSRILNLLSLLAGAAMLAACSASTGSLLASRKAVPAETTEPLPAGVKPLTLEQEEAVGQID
ncbi:MAG: hypothetical protein M9955_09640 [Rhizobiaceae bacterium]|nr:hypothetical protein [Rhizobiaceae bacterium]